MGEVDGLSLAETEGCKWGEYDDWRREDDWRGEMIMIGEGRWLWLDRGDDYDWRGEMIMIGEGIERMMVADGERMMVADGEKLIIESLIGWQLKSWRGCWENLVGGGVRMMGVGYEWRWERVTKRGKPVLGLKMLFSIGW
jgi:hypothetical protein